MKRHTAGEAFWIGMLALMAFVDLALAVALTIGLFQLWWGTGGLIAAAIVWAFPTVMTWTWWLFRAKYEKPSQ
ncbi:hypothetical protein [Microbacterium sp. KNMS]